MGYTTSYAKTRISIANNCWGLLTASVAAVVVSRFPRRVMFMTSAATMCMIFLGFTVSFKSLSDAANHKPKGYHNDAAGKAALFFFFAFSPCYNIGNNAITYSMILSCSPLADNILTKLSLPYRALPLRTESSRYRNRAVLGQGRWLLLCPD